MSKEQIIICRHQQIGKIRKWNKQLRPEVKIEESNCQKLLKELLTALERIDLIEKGCKLRGVGYDLEVHRIVEAALAEAKKTPKKGVKNDS